MHCSAPDLVRASDNTARITATVELAAAHAGQLLILDDIDALVPAALGLGVPSTELRVAAALIRALRRLQAQSTQHGGMVLALTARPDALPADLLDVASLAAHALELRAPTCVQREAILARLSRGLQPPPDVATLAAATQGYRAADLANVVREAVLGAWRGAVKKSRAGSDADRVAEDAKASPKGTEDIVPVGRATEGVDEAVPVVPAACFTDAVRRTRPAALAGTQTASSVARTWPPLCGCDAAVVQLEELLLTPLRQYSTFASRGSFGLVGNKREPLGENEHGQGTYGCEHDQTECLGHRSVIWNLVRIAREDRLVTAACVYFRSRAQLERMLWSQDCMH